MMSYLLKVLDIVTGQSSADFSYVATPIAREAGKCSLHFAAGKNVIASRGN